MGGFAGSSPVSSFRTLRGVRPCCGSAGSHVVRTYFSRLKAGEGGSNSSQGLCVIKPDRTCHTPEAPATPLNRKQLDYAKPWCFPLKSPGNAVAL